MGVQRLANRVIMLSWLMSHLLRRSPGMAIGAGIISPCSAYIFRMPELEAFADPGDLQPLSRNALDDDVVTQGTVPTDHFPLFAHVAAIVAAEAAIRIEMAYIVRIGLPSYFHRWKNVLRKLFLHSHHSFFYQHALARKQVRVFQLVELGDPSANPFPCGGG